MNSFYERGKNARTYHYFWFLLDFLTLSHFNRYQKSDLVKMDILLNGQPVDAMATIIHNQKAQKVGRELVDKLKKFIERYSLCSLFWKSDV
jgi:translation elongation factor EF-4